MTQYYPTQGFTLIELAIVLVIIGLVVGGVLVGQDLIRAAQVRATVTQIEKYNQATNTFYGKYGYLPGDIVASLATQLGFLVTPRAGSQSQGDGNGILEGIATDSTIAGSLQNGETAWFWVDLSTNSHLIEDNLFTATNAPLSNATTYRFSSSPLASLILPSAKIGQGNYIYVYSLSGDNYFGLSSANPILSSIDTNGAFHGGLPALTVAQAYGIDKKTDDGLPQSGTITAQFENWDTHLNYVNGIVWSAGGGNAGASPGTAAAASSLSCFDNGGFASNPMAYSMTQNGGAGVNCALSFRFQ